MRWSYSSVSCYYQCPAKYKGRYIDKLDIPSRRSEAADRGTDIHAHFESALNDPTYSLPYPFDYYGGFVEVLRGQGAKAEHVIVLERDWTPTNPMNEGWVKAILDVSLAAGNIAYNYDWKSGKIYPEHTDQRELYSIMQFCAMPEVDVVIGMHVYVDIKENRISKFTRDQLPELKHKWEEKVRPLYEDEIFPTNPSFSCRFCEFSKANGGPCAF